MADRLLLEASAVDGFLLEDGTGVLLLEVHDSGADLATKVIDQADLNMGFLKVSGG